MEIVVTRDKRKSWHLHIDGKNHTRFFWDKHAIKWYLKRNYEIDLRTDPKIIRVGYTERQQNIVQQRNNIKLIINKPL